ncbi:hypothetical protein OF83DRAFT_1176901 [Amylostereum chailletii]|nr:hypothetical protein OF83DRAFT_1176901 [Amylostereum chailletii]
MSGWSSWYNNQYSMWNRTRRLQVAPYLARTETNTSRNATTMATTHEQTQDEIIDMDSGKEKKQDTLFGPNIGIVNGGPKWTDAVDNEKRPSTDELTPDIVKGWIEKSKESVQPTTTLQALVNLKRPTLRLSPLEISPSDDPDHAESHHHHALEFEFDCDAPKCAISVHVILPSQEQTGKANAKGSRMLVYESNLEGGFGRDLKLADGATLELGRFEPATPEMPASSKTDSPTVGASPVLPELVSQPAEPDRKHRFTAAFRRRTNQHRSVSGPAIAVVDAEAQPPTGDEEKIKEDKDENSDEGVRVVIQLTALNEDGTRVQPLNEQFTYLHVVRFGARSSEGPDTRPWMVKVVKREATIGPHTFHLHEIYGLSSSSSSHTHPPAAPLPETHTYPPVSPTVPLPQHDDEPSSECLLCLSSPREVVLLPCRHLVACKECAINMVEFGAGGNIVHNEEATAATEATTDPAPAEDSAGEGQAAMTSEGSPAVTSGTDADPQTSNAPPASGGEAATTVPSIPQITPVPAHSRRKRRAKGWFCPVCRQPYTSLLRITTTPPSQEEMEGKRISTSTIDHPLSPVAPAEGEEVQARSSLRPSFLPSISRSSLRTDPATIV